MMKVHRVTLLIVDHDDLGVDALTNVLEDARYPNRCISPTVLAVETREVEWTDDHPLNDTRTTPEQYAAIFESLPEVKS